MGKLLYYNVDTDRYNDMRILRLKRAHGVAGLACYDYVLCRIYGDEGYFLKWDADVCFMFSEFLGIKENRMREIIGYCCSVGLFNKELLACGSVLTSASIQRRYVEIIEARQHRKGIKDLIEERYDLIGYNNIFQQQTQKSEQRCAANVYTCVANSTSASQNIESASQGIGNAPNFAPIKERKERKESVCVNAHTRETPTAASGDTHRDFIFEIEKAFFLRGYIAPQRIAKEMVDYYTGEGKDLRTLPLKQAVAKVTNWNPKTPQNYPKINTDIAELLVLLLDRMEIATPSKQKMLEAFREVDFSGSTLTFRFVDMTVGAAFRAYCKDYADILGKYFNGQMKYIEAM